MKEKIKEEIRTKSPDTKGEIKLAQVGNVYRIMGHIERDDFRRLDARYWDREYIEDCGDPSNEPGWYINISAVDTLRNLGYAIEIETGAMRRQKERERLQRISERNRRVSERKARFIASRDEFERFLGNPKYNRFQCEDDFEKANQFRHYIRSGYRNEHISYCLLADGRIYSFRCNGDGTWSDSLVSIEPVSEQAQRWFLKKGMIVKIKQGGGDEKGNTRGNQARA